MVVPTISPPTFKAILFICLLRITLSSSQINWRATVKCVGKVNSLSWSLSHGDSLNGLLFTCWDWNGRGAWVGRLTHCGLQIPCLDLTWDLSCHHDVCTCLFLPLFRQDQLLATRCRCWEKTGQVTDCIHLRLTAFAWLDSICILIEHVLMVQQAPSL